MTDKLSLYNLALGHLRQRRLGSLSDANEPRRVLDDFYPQVVAECLAEGLWKFMTRSVRIDASASITPSFGWAYAFAIPDDWVRTIQISDGETFDPPLLDYVEEAGYWYANSTPLFVRLVSNDTSYGMDLSLWPANFTGFVAFYLAEYSCGRITGSDDLLKGEQGIIRRTYKAKIRAKATDAMNDPPGQPPMGTWARSRRGAFRGLPAPGGTGNDD